MTTPQKGRWANVRVILRNYEGRVAIELNALTGFSLRRAMDSVEGCLDPQRRLAITHELISPLETARFAIGAAQRRPDSHERLVLPGDAAELCRSQYRALCAALAEPGFPYSQLPDELFDPIAACNRFHQAAGLMPPSLGAGPCDVQQETASQGATH